jgi:putative transposase
VQAFRRLDCKALCGRDHGPALVLHRGVALSAVNDRHVTLSALERTINRRWPEAGLLHHSDQACTYVSEEYRTRLEVHGITCSISRRGNC